LLLLAEQSSNYMFARMFRKLKLILAEPSIRRRLGFVLGIFVIFRLLAAIPVPGVNPAALVQLLAQNQLFGILNLFSGGGLSNLSIMLLGVGPFITASIILQLGTLLVPQLKQMYHEEGEAGRKKFNQLARMITVPIAMIQGFSLLAYLGSQGVIATGIPMVLAQNAIIVVAGSLLAMWLGELITEFGIGNGVSLMIFAGIVASIPTSISQAGLAYDPSRLPLYIGFVILAILIVTAVVMITEAERPVPVVYSRQARVGSVGGGAATYMPLRMNQAGVMPIIFAMSILLIPRLVGQALVGSASAVWASVGNALTTFVNSTWAYVIVYFLMVVIFTYFYTAVTFDADATAENLQKNGGFIPGIRPGAPTSEYIAIVMSRITFFGGVFLGLIAVLPQILRVLTGVQAFAIGGTALLIVVSVILDLGKKLSAQASMREY
jgi:preprotein translocase subunit SecY